jgi:hypothetical protein
MTTISRNFDPEHWNDAMRAEMESGRGNGRVGDRIVFENDHIRVWLIEMQPQDRLPFHTHVQDYFWTVTRPGRACSHYTDGRVDEVDYELGKTMYFQFAKGGSMTHDLQNTGDSFLSFVTVEFKGGQNPSLL